MSEYVKSLYWTFQLPNNGLSARAETGVAIPEKGDDPNEQDWPGIFLRGDDAFHLSLLLQDAVEFPKLSSLTKAVLDTYIKLLRSCQVNHEPIE